MRVTGIFTSTTISPGGLLRQCPNHYAIRAGQNLPDKEFRYLRTVIVTAAVNWGFGSMLSHIPLTFQHWAGVSPYTSSFDLAETCVFGKLARATPTPACPPPSPHRPGQREGDTRADACDSDDRRAPPGKGDGVAALRRPRTLARAPPSPARPRPPKPRPPSPGGGRTQPLRRAPGSCRPAPRALLGAPAPVPSSSRCRC